ncbi:ROK family transcriptional regulator [Salisediminibacterium halotolerans]|uniref:Sugar kinase of the NBD/HSP70 family, may contain an N-terminal HTH domain n=1 Tax=Salisediminibacterium halotolerans TaxID=517425 RepID=A0A1H9WJI1_9BACI|nr:ROK family transcriptional regulator [Salisediminibacterium haloalkalitolerans]SES34096.1 Sugar kinase of the NBD/HSP70 family, may contain an N-terminal HTH domain [Salisediminibacterium haloalkalitolerans]
MQTGDQNLVKKLNKSIVLEIVQKKSPVSRTDISRETGLTKATVSSLIGELIDEHFIYEIENGESKGGRKPVMLYFNQQAGFTVGVDIGVDRILGVLSDLNGNLLEQYDTELTDTAVQTVTDEVTRSIKSLCESSPDSPYGIVGAGIGVPGTVGNRGEIRFAPNLGWENVHLKETLEEIFPFPIIIENEANAGAHGEKLYGAGSEASNLVYVSVGTGIGTGIVIDGNLYRGERGFSGEMGHMSIELNGIKCTCGNIGCWELYASEHALLEQAAHLKTFETYEKVSFDDVINEASLGNGEVLTLINTIGNYLGVGVVNIINTFNPEQVIIGNRFARLEKWMTVPVERVLSQRLLPYQQKSFQLKFSSLRSLSCAIGSSAFALAHFFSKYKISIG